MLYNNNQLTTTYQPYVPDMWLILVNPEPLLMISGS